MSVRKLQTTALVPRLFLLLLLHYTPFSPLLFPLHSPILSLFPSSPTPIISTLHSHPTPIPPPPFPYLLLSPLSLPTRSPFLNQMFLRLSFLLLSLFLSTLHSSPPSLRFRISPSSPATFSLPHIPYPSFPPFSYPPILTLSFPCSLPPVFSLYPFFIPFCLPPFPLLPPPSFSLPCPPPLLFHPTALSYRC